MQVRESVRAQARATIGAPPPHSAPPRSYFAHDATQLFCGSLLCCAIASPALADVTLKSKGSGTGMVGAMSGDMTQYVKGAKMRTDQTTGAGRQTTTIIDAARGR